MTGAWIDPIICVIIDIPILIVHLGDHRDHVSSFASTSWPNGGGVSRMLARGDHWRISIAGVPDQATFSVLPGIDRLFVPLLPHTIELHSRSPLSTEASGAVRFRGYEPITVEVTGGAALVANLMVSDTNLKMSARRNPGCLDVAITPRRGH